MSESLYFMAVVPPSDIQEQIHQLKLEVVEKFGSKHALNAPAHITLHMPFRWKDKRMDELTEAMRQINERIVPFQVELKNFGFFEPRVVYIDVVSTGALNDLQKKVQTTVRTHMKLVNANYKDQVFHPHMTIAFRDLKKPAFFKAKAYFEEKSFSARFQAEEVKLLKHDGERWQVLMKAN